MIQRVQTKTTKHDILKLDLIMLQILLYSQISKEQTEILTEGCLKFLLLINYDSFKLSQYDFFEFLESILNQSQILEMNQLMFEIAYSMMEFQPETPR